MHKDCYHEKESEETFYCGLIVSVSKKWYGNIDPSSPSIPDTLDLRLLLLLGQLFLLGLCNQCPQSLRRELIIHVKVKVCLVLFILLSLYLKCLLILVHVYLARTISKSL